jgi:hypothetical protein
MQHVFPLNLDSKERTIGEENRGNTGIHGKRRGWGSIPPVENMEDNTEPVC